MDIANRFAIDARPDEVWALLLDVPRVLPCMPGAELLETVSEREWKARLTTRLGAIKLGFDADLTREIAHADRVVTLRAVAHERSGRGGAEAQIVNRLESADCRTVVHVTTALSLTGTVARFGRHALIRDVADQMTSQFAANLQRELHSREEGADTGPADREPSDAPPTADAKTGRPPSAMRMIAGILVRVLIRKLEQLLHRIEHGKEAM